MTNKKIVFLNTGWMQYYRGLNNDSIKGGGSYVNETGTGGEIYNFLPIDEYVYGYAMPVGKINLARIEPSCLDGDDYIEGVLLVFTATAPEGGVYVVGWHKDAVLYRDIHDEEFTYDINDNNEIVNASKKSDVGEFDSFQWYISRTRKENVTLLNIDERVLQVPTGKGGKGQSNIWYADQERGLYFREEVYDFISDYEHNQLETQKRRKKTAVDSEYNKQIEIAAINHITDLYTSKGYAVVSRERDNVGWDLEARKGGKILRIEVKGKAGKDVDVRLSPNEYEKMNKYFNRGYRLAVVVDALVSPAEYIFYYSEEKKAWVDTFDSDVRLDIEEITEARCRTVITIQ